MDGLELEEADADRFRSITVDIGYGRSRTFYDLVMAWNHHVERLRKEAGKQEDDARFTWNEHDYVAALFLRDNLESGLRTSEDDRARKAVDKVDASFRSFTGEGPAELLPRLADVSPDNRGWWWRRVPLTGPVARDLDRYPG